MLPAMVRGKIEDLGEGRADRPDKPKTEGFGLQRPALRVSVWCAPMASGPSPNTSASRLVSFPVDRLPKRETE